MYEKFAEILGKENVLQNEEMKKHTTFHIGGPAEYFLKCYDVYSLKKIISFLKEKNITPFILGNGSNILVGDFGIKGVVIQINIGNQEVSVKGDRIEAGAGMLLSKLSNIAYKHSLSGLEEVSGIPGTFGGAIYMNAGAYGGEISDSIESVTFINENAEIVTVSKEECGFGYRKSIFTDSDKIIVSAVLKLKNALQNEIKEKMLDYTNRRVTKQPIEKFSAGSTFKRPEGNFAGTLIENAGLKGYKIGGAEVSEKHAGFVINESGATAKEVIDLICHIQRVVFDKFGILLETEVKKIGEFEGMN